MKEVMIQERKRKKRKKIKRKIKRKIKKGKKGHQIQKRAEEVNHQIIKHQD